MPNFICLVFEFVFVFVSLGHNLMNDLEHGCQWETEAFSANCIRAAHSQPWMHTFGNLKLTRQLKGTDGGQHFSGSVTLEAAQTKVMVPK